MCITIWQAVWACRCPCSMLIMRPFTNRISSSGSCVLKVSSIRRATFPLNQTRCYSDRNPRRQEEPRAGTTTPIPDENNPYISKSVFYFEAGYALFAKRPSRPFPPPFTSRPSASFSDPLSTHDKSRDRRPKVNGEMIRGITNGDDAVLVSDNLIAANDGVGAWAHKEKGHAA